jgi:hypothetical protein
MGKMKNSTWTITTLKDGRAVASVEGVSHRNAVAAIRNAMYGREPLADVVGGHITLSAEKTGELAAA